MLKRQGFFYPNPSLEINAGNASKLYQETAEDLRTYAKEASQNKCHTLILSSEMLPYVGPKNEFELYAWRKKLDTVFQATLVVCARELYTWYWSHVMQGVKMAGNPVYFQKKLWTDISDRVNPLPLWLETFENHIFINYTAHQKTFISHVCRRVGINSEAEGMQPVKTCNRSFSLSEFNILRGLYVTKRGSQKGGGLKHISFPLMARDPNKASFCYYDEKQARLLYKQYGSLLEKLNMYLPEDEQLPTQAFQPPGYTTEWDKKYTEEEDLKFVANLLKQQPKALRASLQKRL